MYMHSMPMKQPASLVVSLYQHISWIPHGAFEPQHNQVYHCSAKRGTSSLSLSIEQERFSGEYIY